MAKKIIKTIHEKSYATKEDLNQLMKAVTQIASTVNDFVNTPSISTNKPAQEIPGTADMSKIKESNMPSVEKQIEDGSIEKMPIPPDWRKMVDEILGLDFGIDIVYPQSGSGFLFKIIVPAEKSNVTPAHKELYRVDIRTRAISYADGIEGIRKFCELIKVNLKRKQDL